VDEDEMRRNWRMVGLHALRIKYAALLFGISQHRRKIREQTVPREQADLELWDFLDREKF
jgi:hypothetical protein